MRLKGSYYGKEKFKEYKTYDIMTCEILDNYHNINDLYVNITPYNNLNIRHYCRSTLHNESGMWHNLDVKATDIMWDDDDHYIYYVIPEYYVDCNFEAIMENVPVRINFTSDGYNKFKSFIQINIYV